MLVFQLGYLFFPDSIFTSDSFHVSAAFLSCTVVVTPIRSFLPPSRRGICDHIGLSVILSLCLSAGLLQM